jgi:hypothetical protein
MAKKGNKKKGQGETARLNAIKVALYPAIILATLLS